jgi:hypothetical protein
VKRGEHISPHRPKVKRTPVDRLLEELRGSMVEALLDAQRERRKEGDEHLRLAEVATQHSLELAEQYLILDQEG